MESLVEESNQQLLLAWRRFSRAYPTRETGELPGLSIAWGGVPFFSWNALIQSSPIVSREDLLARAEIATSYFRVRNLPGILILRDVDEAPPLSHAWKMTGMVADSISPPMRPLPKPEFRRVEDRKTLADLYDVNAFGYGMDPEPGRASVGPPEDWLGDTFAFVAYEGGEPVACAATFPLDGRLHVSRVATIPGAQRRGLAEAVMRHSLQAAHEATGLSRSVLHASDEGLPLYLRMGYRPTALFNVYR